MLPPNFHKYNLKSQFTKGERNETKTLQWGGLRKDAGHSRNLIVGRPQEGPRPQPEPSRMRATLPKDKLSEDLLSLGSNALGPQAPNEYQLHMTELLKDLKHEIVCVVTMACTVCHCSREKAAPGSLRDRKVPS